MRKRLEPNALGMSVALLSALCMLALGFLGVIGVYEGAVRMMEEWHLFFSISVGGILAGIVEGAFWGYVLGGLTAVFYNWFVSGPRGESPPAGS